MPGAEIRLERSATATRGALALLAAAVLVWLAIGARNNILIAHGLHATSLGGAGRNAAQAESDFKRARLFNPDGVPDLDRALLYSVTGRRHQAVLVVERVLRDEPQNTFAWTELLAFTNGHNDRVAERALAAVKRLDPLIGRTG